MDVHDVVPLAEDEVADRAVHPAHAAERPGFSGKGDLVTGVEGLPALRAGFRVPRQGVHAPAQIPEVAGVGQQKGPERCGYGGDDQEFRHTNDLLSGNGATRLQSSPFSA